MGRHLLVGLICSLVILVMAASAGQAAPAYSRVSMTVENGDVRDVLSSLAAVGRVNIVVDESVKGKISLSLNNVGLLDALDMVVKTRGFAYQVMPDGTIVVAEAKTLLAGYGMVTVFPLKYAVATEVKKAVAGVVPDDRLKVIESTNTLVHFGSPSEAATLYNAVNSLDVPGRQVTIEAQVVQIKKTVGDSFGIDWSWAPGPQQSAATGTENYENLGAIRFGRAPDGKPYEFRYSAKINALVSHGDAKVLAKPRVSTISGKEAKILVGDKIPVQSQTTTNGTTSTTITYVDTGIRLVYTPIVSPEGQIQAHLLAEVSEPSAALGGTNYQISTRTAETDVIMKDGETLVIGGLINSKTTHDRNQVPILSQVPILGALFKSSTTTKEDTEIVVFLTATIMK